MTREWTHVARDGARLMVRCTAPAQGAGRGTILLTHGMGEHSGRYHHVARHLAEAGLRVLTWDLRGHGRSEGRRGDIRRYGLLEEDLLELWSMATAERGPVFLYGHSLGGQITLNFAIRHRPAAAGMIITSPWLRLAFVPPLWKTSLAWLAVRTWPSFTQDTDVMPWRLSRDLDFLKAMPDQHLIHNRMSARMYRALTEGAERAARDGVELPYPMLLIHGANDPVTSVEATKQFFHALQSRDKALVIVPEALHETHNDLCRETVLARITEWLEERLPAL
jgi:alpha-beta hydrolase superfamily lysophospholipase